MLKLFLKNPPAIESVLVLRGSGLSDQVSDADPKKEGKAPKEIIGLDGSPEAEKTAQYLISWLVNLINFKGSSSEFRAN